MILLAPDHLFDGTEILTSPLLALEEDGTIIRIGKNPGGEGKPVKGLISPGFINCHLHLELSGMKGRVPARTGLQGFVQAVQKLRGSSAAGQAIEESEKEMFESGTVAAIDICNGNSSIPVKVKSGIEWLSMVELFGYGSDQALSVFEKGEVLKKEFERNGLSCEITPHAPYSVSEELLNLIIDNAGAEALLTIHNQENASEDVFLESASGPFATMLEGFGIDPESGGIRARNFPEYIIPFLPDSLKLLLVHNTFTEPSTIKKLANHPGIAWCFCPRANMYIEETLPDIPAFYNAGATVVFGTDSLASNVSLDLFAEASLVSHHFSEISLTDLLRSLTSVPAQLLGKPGLGKIAPGTRPGLVLIEGLDDGLKKIPYGAKACRFM